MAAGTKATKANTVTAAPTSKKTPANAITMKPIVPCPREGCDGSIILGRKGYGCSSYREGCSFVIWKASFNKSLTETMIKSLVSKGKTSKLKFQNKAGISFDGTIHLVVVGLSLHVR